MSSAISGTLRIKSPYEFGANHAGPVACELMSRYPDLAIRIDVEHEIVSPVAENYDIVFAMLEAPLPSTGLVIRRVSSLERGLYAAPALLEQFGTPRTLADLARLPMLTAPNDAPWALTTPDGVTEHFALQKARLVNSNADIRLQGGARRARRVTGDGELYQCCHSCGIAAAAAAGSCLRAASRARFAAGPPVRSGQGALFSGCAGPQLRVPLLAVIGISAGAAVDIPWATLLALGALYLVSLPILAWRQQKNRGSIQPAGLPEENDSEELVGYGHGMAQAGSGPFRPTEPVARQTTVHRDAVATAGAGSGRGDFTADALGDDQDQELPARRP